MLLQFLKNKIKSFRSESYWSRASSSELAPQEFYLRQENVLRSRVFPLISEHSRILDIGCGSGRFGLVFAEKGAYVYGIDIAKNLIHEARLVTKSRGLKATFEVGSIDSIRHLEGEAWDVILLLGVCSTLVDSKSVAMVYENVNRLLRKGGLLLVRESLSLGTKDESYENKGYLAVYRAKDEYIDSIMGAGFQLIDLIDMATDSDKATNPFFSTKTNLFMVFKKQ